MRIKSRVGNICHGPPKSERRIPCNRFDAASVNNGQWSDEHLTDKQKSRLPLSALLRQKQRSKEKKSRVVNHQAPKLRKAAMVLVGFPLTGSDGHESVESGIVGRVRAFHDALHPVHSVAHPVHCVAGLRVQVLLRLAGREPLECVHVGVNHAVDMGSALLNRLSVWVDGDGAMIPAMALALAGCADHRRRHGVLVAAAVRGRATGRWHRCGKMGWLDIGVESHCRFHDSPALLAAARQNSLVNVVGPGARTVTGRCMDLEPIYSTLKLCGGLAPVVHTGGLAVRGRNV